MKSKSLEAFYTKFADLADAAPNTMPSAALREVGHFNIFRVADLMRSYPNKLPMTFDRQEYYKICLIRGHSRVEYADKVVEIAHNALWVATSRVPYRWVPHTLEQTGYFCLFTEAFLLPAKTSVAAEDLPIFQPAACPVVELTDEQYATVETVFEKMAQEIASGYTYKYDLLRAHLWELIHMGQKLQPTPAPLPGHNASARVAALFAELLERQFPLATPQQQLRLRTPKDYADHLAVHVNHLNRVLKETTGHTTSALIGDRVAQEARMLLRQTSWTVSEIADSLGFSDVAHFCNFFKRQTSLTPGDFRG
ncbi:helix-turn-helix transcriptional regulator [Hymenobacter lucidus]|uniref:Helix-turn-helix transcriptional regulator n=1 Tax=Hymenobacter lucidus TaxID=2880930 RepID=A0ABS8AK17_9BACT|nr:AraC family transcriptional regulator [Hymenobacter lucidus]MCB2406469.1 helix-turn-helix transcriptional regulator [Hymenobacter lucidus]